MGEWQTERGMGSDEMADVLGGAFAKIRKLGQPALIDLADAIEFVSRGYLVVELHKDALYPNVRRRNGKFSVGEVLFTPDLFPTIKNRGQVQGGTYESHEEEEEKP